MQKYWPTRVEAADAKVNTHVSLYIADLGKETQGTVVVGYFWHAGGKVAVWDSLKMELILNCNQ